MRGEEGAQEMGFPQLKFAALSVFIVILSSNLSGTAESQELSANDIPNIIVTYYENNLKYNQDYLGKTFIATMFFDDIGGKVFGDDYFVGFNGVNGSAGVTCSFPGSLPNEVNYWEAGKSVSLSGIVHTVVFTTLYLERCEFK